MGKYDVGTIHETSQGYKIKVIKDISHNKKKIKFLDEHGYITEAPTSSISRGKIKNPFHPALLGKGFLGVGIYKSKDYEYKIWKGILNNVYNEEFHVQRETSKKVKLCREWHNYQTFAKDVNEMYGFNMKDESGKPYHINKDILSTKKRVYSKKTCVFVPPRINTFLNQNKKKEGGLPTGVKYRHQDQRYEARINIDGKSVYLGSCLTIELARDMYIKARNKRARELADIYKGKVDSRVIEFLQNYNEINHSE